MQKKKILHFISGLDVGGAETMLLKTLPEMQNKNLDNRVCCARGRGEIGKRLEEIGIKVYYLEINSIFQLLRFGRVIKDFQPEVLVTYLIHADLVGRLLGKIYRIKKIVCSQRGVLLNWEWLRFFDRLSKFLVTKYIVQTEAAKRELMEKLHLPAKKFIIIPNSINLSEFNFIIDKGSKKKELLIDPGRINLICVSNLRRGKGHEYLLESFEKTFKINPNINLLIVGDGEKKEELIKKIKYYSSKNNILFLGKRNDVKELLKISDVFILPTLGEGMSNAILEAMASGLPVITTDLEVNREIIEDKKDGLLVPTRNANAIYEATIKLLDNTAYRASLGESGKRKIIKNFNSQKIIRKLEDFLKKI